jgi:glycosyltransferase involved in cell wall biosynthesis
MKLPRVLFLTSESPHTAAAGAIVFHRLFQNYPADRLLVVTNTPPPPAAGRLNCNYVTLPLAVDRLNRTRFWRWRTAGRALGGASLIRLARIDQALDGFVPDVVVTLMQDSWYYDLAARYARQRHLPLVLFIHDVASGFEPVAAWLRPHQLRRDAAVYRQADRRLCISRGMVDYFQKAFEVTGEVLPPPRSDHMPGQPPQACRELKEPGRLVLGYAGGLHYGYGEQLLQLLPVLRATNTIIELFGPSPGGNLTPLREATDVLRFNGYAATPEEAWRGLLARCDAILQPYLNPPGEHAAQYATHFPSKLGDCLALGLPLLITGPAEASGMAWCLAHPGCALTVTATDRSDLIDALHRLRDDPALRMTLAAAGQKAATNFDSAPLRAQLQRCLRDAVAAH